MGLSIQPFKEREERAKIFSDRRRLILGSECEIKGEELCQADRLIGTPRFGVC